MNQVLKYKYCILLIFILCSSIAWQIEKKPTIYLIGDSTVDNGSGNNGLWGWGKFLDRFFDTTRINIKNYAQGGTSARTFQNNGIWDKRINKRGMWDTVYAKLKKGDYLIIQFGLNDAGKIDDTARARGTLHGIGDDSIVIYNAVTKQQETVRSFGWYLRKFIQQAKSKGVSVIVCSSVPKNVWKDGKIVQGENGFASWALEVAAKEKASSINLNKMIAEKYDLLGEEIVTKQFHFGTDNTHTTEPAAILNASLVAKGILSLKKCDLKNYTNKNLIQVKN
ncbi:MAG: rhamnogalacturonan acetylesterase [Bacteroidetes bacterium]|jgi:lysophospholipase L1-like esterase|nr:rhamnogalacturonan acetylesterase [Bacteroidota bacterium]